MTKYFDSCSIHRFKDGSWRHIMDVARPQTAELYTAMITGEDTLLWYLAVSIATGLGLVFDILILERRCSREPGRSPPNIERMYIGCGFDNPEQSWENWLIRTKGLEKEIARVQAIRALYVTAAEVVFKGDAESPKEEV